MFTYPSAFYLTLYTHLHQVAFLSFGKATNSQVTLPSNIAIFSSMALSHLGFLTTCSKQVGSTSYITLTMYAQWWTTKPSYVSFCTRYLDSCGSLYATVVVRCFQSFLGHPNFESSNWRDFWFFTHTLFFTWLTIYMRIYKWCLKTTMYNVLKS